MAVSTQGAMTPDPVQQLEAAVGQFEIIDNELEQLKTELLQRSSHIPSALTRHESQILAAEKAINKELIRSRKSLIAASSQPVLNFGTVTPEMENNMDVLVARHLEQNGFQTVVQLMRQEHEREDSDTESTNLCELADFELKARDLFAHVADDTLTVKVAAQLGISRDMFRYLNEVGLQLGVYEALSRSLSDALTYLQTKIAEYSKKNPTLSPSDISSGDTRAAQISALSGQLVSLSSEDARRKYEALKHSVFNKLLLFFGSHQDLLTVDKASSPQKLSDLELLAEASQQALSSSFKELRLVDWNSDGELPVELKLDSSKFYFHPIFVCPVTREQSATSSIVLLKCGHLLSKEAFHRFVVMQGESKCPYCPALVHLNEEKLVRLTMV